MIVHRYHGLFGLMLWAGVPMICGAQDAPCLVGYEQALAVYNTGDLTATLSGLDTLREQCTEDTEQLHRVLLLSAVSHLRLDSVTDMRRDLEAMLRNDRHMELKPYEELIKDHPAVWSTFDEDLSVKFRKDHGRLRGGLHVGGRMPFVSIDGDRKVFEADEPYRYGRELGYEVGALMELDVAHNIALRISAGYSSQRYTARNNAIRYEETLTSVPLFLGIKKMFWLSERSPWVPYLLVGATYAPLVEASADIERSGDGVRFLAPKTVDRTSEREQEQIFGSGAVGLSYKVGHVVLFAEGQYDLAFGPLMPDTPAYSETELLTRYYYVDNQVTLSGLTARVGLQYVIKYHTKNRLYP